MKEKILISLKPYGYKVIELEKTLLIKSYFGNLKISCFDKSYEISKKLNFNNYLIIIFLIFFFSIVYEGRQENSVIIYVIIVVSILLQIYYNAMVLEMRKNKLHSILDRLYSSQNK